MLRAPTGLSRLLSCRSRFLRSRWSPVWPFDNWPNRDCSCGDHRQAQLPDGRYSPGYPKFSASLETRDGIRILRCPVFPSHDYSAIKRIASYTSFALSTSLLARGPLAPPMRHSYSERRQPPHWPRWWQRRNSGTPYVLSVPRPLARHGFCDGVLQRLTNARHKWRSATGSSNNHIGRHPG